MRNLYAQHRSLWRELEISVSLRHDAATDEHYRQHCLCRRLHFLARSAQGMTNMQTVSASAHRIFDFLESEEMPDESEKTTVLTDVRGAAGFERVCFSSPDPPPE